MTSDPSSYHREYLPQGWHSLFQFEGSDVISVLRNSIEYSFVFFKCLLKISLTDTCKMTRKSSKSQAVTVLTKHVKIKELF